MRDWLTLDQTLTYVLAHYQCGSGVEAHELVIEKIKDGTIRTRYENGPDIVAGEWIESGRLNLMIEGAEIGHGQVEYQRASVEKLCGATPKGKNAGGRPLKDWETFLIEVIAIADRPDGLPAKQADLEKRMLLWAENNMADPPAETAVRDMVSAIYRRKKQG